MKMMEKEIVVQLGTVRSTGDWLNSLDFKQEHILCVVIHQSTIRVMQYASLSQKKIFPCRKYKRDLNPSWGQIEKIISA